MSVQRLLERKYDVVVVITHLVTNHTVLDVQLAMLALIQMQSRKCGCLALLYVY
jgi:hypothetical protein